MSNHKDKPVVKLELVRVFTTGYALAWGWYLGRWVFSLVGHDLAQWLGWPWLSP